MNLRQIEVFRAIMQNGGISGAARALHVSQPNISRLLQHTEDSLGMRLFERIKGRLYATPEARFLYAEVEKAYRGIEILHDIARDLAESRVGRLRLACSPSLGLALVPQAIAHFCQGRTELQVGLEIMPQAELIEAVMTQQADLGIAMFPSDDPALMVETLCRGKLMCVMPQGHALLEKSEVTPADLAAYPLISYHRDTSQGRMIEDAFAQAQIAQKIAIEVRFGHTACALVLAGAGIALVDEFSVMGGSFAKLELREFSPQHNFIVSLLQHRWRPATRAAIGFAAELRKLVA